MRKGWVADPLVVPSLLPSEAGVGREEGVPDPPGCGLLAWGRPGSAVPPWSASAQPLQHQSEDAPRCTSSPRLRARNGQLVRSDAVHSPSCRGHPGPFCGG